MFLTTPTPVDLWPLYWDFCLRGSSPFLVQLFVVFVGFFVVVVWFFVVVAAVLFICFE